MITFDEKNQSCKILRYCTFKAIGQPPGTAERVKESRWETAKGYLIASGQFLKGVGKLQGNSQITPNCQKERRQNCLAAIGKTAAISIPYL